MKRHINQLRNFCGNTEFFCEDQSQTFSDLVLSSREHKERFSPSTEELCKNEKTQKTEKNEENER